MKNIILMTLIFSTTTYALTLPANGSAPTPLKFNLTSPIGRVIEEKGNGSEHVYVGYFCLSRKSDDEAKNICDQAQFGKGRTLSLGVDFLGNPTHDLGNWEPVGPIFDAESGNEFYLKSLASNQADEFKDIWKAVWSREGYSWSEHPIKVKKSKLNKFLKLIENFSGGYRPPVLNGACETGVYQNRSEFSEIELNYICTAKNTIKLDSILSYNQCVLEKSKFSAAKEILVEACISLIPPAPPREWLDPLEEIHNPPTSKHFIKTGGSFNFDYDLSREDGYLVLTNMRVSRSSNESILLPAYRYLGDEDASSRVCGYLGFSRTVKGSEYAAMFHEGITFAANDLNSSVFVKARWALGKIYCTKAQNFVIKNHKKENGMDHFEGIRLTLNKSEIYPVSADTESAEQFCENLGFEKMADFKPKTIEKSVIYKAKSDHLIEKETGTEVLETVSCY